MFYCVCGEGMGHAIRTGAIVDRIKDRYDVHIFTSERAYKYLSSKFDNVYDLLALILTHGFSIQLKKGIYETTEYLELFLQNLQLMLYLDINKHLLR